MKLTIEEMKSIVANAPKSATTVRVSKCKTQFSYGRCDNIVGGNVFSISSLNGYISKHECEVLRDCDIPPNTIIIYK